MAVFLLLSSFPSEGRAAADVPPGPAAARAPATSTRNGPLRVVFFHTTGCEECDKVEERLPALLTKWHQRVELVDVDASGEAGLAELCRYHDHYDSGSAAPPVVFVGRRCLAGSADILRELDAAIEGELEVGAATFEPTARAASANGPGARTSVRDGNLSGTARSRTAGRPDDAGVIAGRFEQFSVAAVAVTGLADGVNPCAFTTIVFLLSMLAYLGRSRRQMLAVGAGFTTAVFVTYFLLGLGLLEALKAAALRQGLSVALAWIVALLAFVLAAWSLVDAIRCWPVG